MDTERMIDKKIKDVPQAWRAELTELLTIKLNKMVAKQGYTAEGIHYWGWGRWFGTFAGELQPVDYSRYLTQLVVVHFTAGFTANGIYWGLGGEDCPPSVTYLKGQSGNGDTIPVLPYLRG